MGQHFGLGGAQEVDDDVSAVSGGSIMVQPEILSPPKVGPAATDLLPQISHGLQVNVSVYPLSSRDELTVDDASGIPECDQHDFADIAVLTGFLRPAFIAPQPCS